uniref:3-dehydroquinate dehydratase n=1 Tax=uncultured Desulfobacterium sp. TaxID=201089 RepID=E1YFE2_9BACT|nr:3-dehydroquinate dehydratase [uncultured Desulfobacterium sp.]
MKKQLEQRIESQKIIVIHGPNLNMLGAREPDKYGTVTLTDINKGLVKLGEKLGVIVDTFQSNHEGLIVDKIQDASLNYDGVIINPAAYTHTSIAVRDALLLLKVPIIEIHLSNIFKREPFRHKSMISDIATGTLCGFGHLGYYMALEAISSLLKK